jgi:23S rRNA pseudouridine2605 synthase
VMRLARVSHAGVTSEDLRPGQWRPLTVDELVQLKKDFGVPKKVRPPQLAWDAGKTERTERKGPRAGVWAKDKGARSPSAGRGGDRRKGAFQTEGEAPGPAQGERFSNRSKAPYRAERGETRGSADGARSVSRKAPFSREAREPAGGARSASRKAPFSREAREPAGGARSSSRKAPFQGERAQAPRRGGAEQPWKSKGHPSIEKRPDGNRPAGGKGGGKSRSMPTAPRGGRASSRRP